MSVRKIWTAALGVVVAIHMATPSLAQAQATAPTAPQISDAARDFKNGLFERALPTYKAVFTSSGKASDGLKALDCARKAGDFDEAFAIATTLSGLPKLATRDRKVVDQALDDIRTQTGTVEIVAPAGSSIEIGGRARGSAPPAHPFHVLPGLTFVRVTGASARPWEQTVDVSAGGTIKVEASPTPIGQSGGILFIAEAKGKPAHVFLDDKDVGPAPWHGTASAGTHQVALRGPKLRSDLMLVEVENDRQQSLTLSATSTVGHLRLDVTPSSATTRVDGAPVAPNVRDVEINVGAHRVAASAQAYVPMTRDVEIGPDVTTDVALHLLPAVTEPKTEYAGFYGAFTIDYLQPFKSPTLCDNAGANTSACNSASYGGGFALRLGYSTSYLGIELVVAPFGSYFSQSYHHGALTSSTDPIASVDYDQKTSAYGVGGFAGLGPRVTSHGTLVRFTGGLQLGVGWHDYFTKSSRSTGDSNSTNGGVSQLAPGGMADLAIEIGSTPSERFVIGPVAYLELPSALTIADATNGFPAITFDGGPSLFFGAMIGFFFGH
jgi:hypothetical protein